MFNQAMLRLAVTFRSRRGDRGATAVEYGLIVALIAAVIIAVVSAVGGETGSGFGTFNDNFNAATSS